MIRPALAVRQQLAQSNLPQRDNFEIVSLLDEIRTRFSEVMDDDFNSPAALAVLFDYSKRVNKLLSAEKQAARATLEEIDTLYQQLAGQVLGVLPKGTDSGTNAKREAGLIQILIDTRSQARLKQDFDTYDAIRKRLQDLGVILEDSKEDTTWKISRS